MEFSLKRINNNISEMRIQFPVDAINAALSKLKPAQFRDADDKPMINPAANRIVSIPRGSRDVIKSSVRAATVVSRTGAERALAQNMCPQLVVGCKVVKDTITSVGPTDVSSAMSTVLPYIGCHVVERNQYSSGALSISRVSGSAPSLFVSGSNYLQNILDGSDGPSGGGRASGVSASTPFMRYECLAAAANTKSSSSQLYDSGLSAGYSHYYRQHNGHGASLMSSLLVSGDTVAAAQTQGNILYLSKAIRDMDAVTAAVNPSVSVTPWGSRVKIATVFNTEDGSSDHRYWGRNRAIYGRYANKLMSGDSVEGIYTKVNSLPVCNLFTGLVLFVNIIDGTNEFMPLPESMEMLAWVTNDELGEAYKTMVTDMGEDDIKLAFDVFKSVPVADLRPTSLIPDNYKGDTVEFLSSPIVKSMVKAIHRGWCYANPASADEEFESNPPLQYRAIDRAKSPASLAAVRDHTRYKGMLLAAVDE